MNARDLRALIANGENSGVQFKRDDLCPEQLAGEVVALANFQGGRVLIGVEDDGTIVGIQRRGLDRWVMDAVFGQTVHPLILPFYEEVASTRSVGLPLSQSPRASRSLMWFATADARTSTSALAARHVGPRANSRRGCSIWAG